MISKQISITSLTSLQANDSTKMRLNDDKKIKTIDKDQASSYLEIKEIFNDNELVKQIPGPQ